MTLDEWAAEQCGMLYSTFDGCYKYRGQCFDLQDTRCLMICVRHWKINLTTDSVGMWWADAFDYTQQSVFANTPEEAIRACIKAIRGASDD